MPDRYQQLTQQLTATPLGQRIVDTLGVPTPPELRRHDPSAPLTPGPVLVTEAAGGELGGVVRAALEEANVAHVDGAAASERLGGIVFDASGIDSIGELDRLYETIHGAIRQLTDGARVLVLGAPPDHAAGVAHATVQRALEGFTRSLAKELRGGSTAQLVQVATSAAAAMDGPLRFLLSGRSAYVDGQVIRIEEPVGEAPAADPLQPHAMRVAVVTGASRGIGAAIAEVLARDGAHVVCLDLPAQASDLTAVANKIGGETLQLDITADDAPDALAEHLLQRHGGADVIVHNAGITRDKTIAGMDAARWRSVLEVNLAAQMRIDETLLERKVLRPEARIVSVSSVSGIAGNRGQTNYATSKAGVIGRVQALAPLLRERGITINAVAPGFIETEMTDAMPIAVREAGRRMNSLSQGGRPLDVAETVAWLAEPTSAGVTGQVVRVCGQSMLGA